MDSTAQTTAGRPRTDCRLGVIGVLRDANRVLMVRRAPSVPKGGFWCFPGGHVDPGETLESALRREMLEELGITVTPVSAIGSVFVPDTNHVLSIWLADWTPAPINPAPREIDAYSWVPVHEITNTGPGLPSNRDVHAMLCGSVAPFKEKKQ
jgi:8-oxo-dGTP diphosphatase